jgi:hypothetical protein
MYLLVTQVLEDMADVLSLYELNSADVFELTLRKDFTGHEDGELARLAQCSLLVAKNV